MAIQLVDNAVLLWVNGFSAGTPATLRRRWDVETAESLAGDQDRQLNRSQPLRSLSFDLRIIDLDTRFKWMEAVREASRTGRAACPYWGRAQTILTAVSGTTLQTEAETSSWQFSVGDKVLLYEYGVDKWEVAEIATVTDTNNYTLTQAPSRTFPIASLVYPLIFGRISSVRNNHWDSQSGDFSFSISEPIGSGELIDSETDCPTPTDTFSSGNRTFCSDIFTLEVTPKCGGFYELNWNQIPYADNYQVRYSLTQGGPYTSLGNTISTEYEAPRYLERAYYVIAAQAGETEIVSNEVEVDEITIEACMRAFQERHVVALGNLYTWDAVFDRLTDSATPADYPVDGFYDADIAANGDTRIAALVQAVSDLFFDTGILQKYIQVPGLDLLQRELATTELSYYENNLGTERISPFPDTPPTISTGAHDAALRDIAGYICPLKYLPLRLNQDPMDSLSHGEFEFSEYQIKDATILGSDLVTSWPDLLAELQSGWDDPGNDWTGASSAPGEPFTGGVWAYSNEETYPGGAVYYVGQMRAVRYKVQAPVSSYGDGELVFYQALTLELGEPPLEQGQTPPVPVDKKYYESEPRTPLPISGGAYESGWFANQRPVNPELGLQTLWNLYKPLILIVKEHEHWDHFA